MRLKRFVQIATFAVLATAHGLRGQSIATNSAVPLSTRVVDYTIDARVHPGSHMLDATETLTYRNLTAQPLTVFPFHLYLNAFQPDSSFTSETHFGGGIRDNDSADTYPDKKRGSITLTGLSADGFGDLLPALHAVSPDDGNANDRTVAQLALPRPLGPGESITFRINFRDLFPESVARNGYKRDFLMGGQWYPKLGVFWHGAWNCHQYHATTEFFSDFATFHVRLTLPKRYVVGASGVPTGSSQNPDDSQTLSFYGEDIGDFAFAASPHFTTLDSVYQSSLGPVQVHVLSLAAHPKAGPRYRDILLRSMAQFDRRYGAYPYKRLTLIDPEPGSEIGGMEYPTLITGDAALYDPTYTQEITAEHEFGHQYWYGMVATNEFEDAWLDEGINSYTESDVMDAILGRNTSAMELGWLSASDSSLHYLEYLSATDYDPVTRHAWQFRNSNSYGGVTYGKSSMLLHTLAGLIGQDTMDDAMHTYFQRYKFTHPTSEDFLNTIVEVAVAHGRAGLLQPAPSGQQPQQTAQQPQQTAQQPQQTAQQPQQSGRAALVPSTLSPYFEQAVYGTAILDYAIDSIHSAPVRWWLPESDPHQTKQQRSTVTVHRVGDFQVPVEIAVVFSDGTRRLERWDSRGQANDRWHTFTYDSTAHAVSAEIDPAHANLLDVDRFNNSRTVAANGVPARKLTTLWLSMLQAGGQFVGWLV